MYEEHGPGREPAPVYRLLDPVPDAFLDRGPGGDYEQRLLAASLPRALIASAVELADAVADNLAGALGREFTLRAKSGYLDALGDQGAGQDIGRQQVARQSAVSQADSADAAFPAEFGHQRGRAQQTPPQSDTDKKFHLVFFPGHLDPTTLVPLLPAWEPITAPGHWVRLWIFKLLKPAAYKEQGAEDCIFLPCFCQAATVYWLILELIASLSFRLKHRLVFTAPKLALTGSDIGAAKTSLCFGSA